MKPNSASARDVTPLLSPARFTSVISRRFAFKGMVWLELDPPLARAGAMKL